MMLMKYKVLYETNTHKFGGHERLGFWLRSQWGVALSYSVSEVKGFATETPIKNQSSRPDAIFDRNPFVTMTYHCLIVNAIPFFQPLSI